MVNCERVAAMFLLKNIFPLTVKKKVCNDRLFLDTQILVLLAKEMFMPFQEGSLITAGDTGRGQDENWKQK